MSSNPNPDTVIMTMHKTKETKGTVVFTEALPSDYDRERPHTFYILKDTFGELGNPSSIQVTITNSPTP